MYNLELINQRINDARTAMQEATKNSDEAAFAKAQQDMMQAMMEKLLAEHEEIGQQANDVQVLAQRGVRQLTSQERTYYQKVMDAMRSQDPKQALSNLDTVMPKTVIDSVFEDLQVSDISSTSTTRPAAESSPSEPHRLPEHQRPDRDDHEHRYHGDGGVGRSDR